MAETIDELTVNYTDESGQQIVEEIDKEVLSKGSWTTILFRYREWDRKKEVWGEEKARIERYQDRKSTRLNSSH